MAIRQDEFILSRSDGENCAIVVDSSLEDDLSSAEWLAENVEAISGSRPGIERAESATDERRTEIIVGTLPESPGILKRLESQNILLGLETPQGQAFLQMGIRCLSPEDAQDTIRSCRLRRDYLHPDALGEQGFIVYKSSDDSLILAGGGPQGTLYAVQTLINHLFLEDDNLKVEGLHSERFPIFNRPAIPYRGLCTNIGGPDHLSHNQWEKEWGKDGEYDYKKFIDWLVGFRVNHINIWLFELGFGIAYPSKKFPECVNRYHPNVKNEFIGDMIDYAHRRFIDVSMFIDFPDMFSGVLRHHPELGAEQFDASQLPPEEDWKAFQKTGANREGHDFRGALGTVCASRPEVMSFWTAYLEETFERYPGLDGIMGQFAEALTNLCTCDDCRKNFFKLQQQYFKRMADIAQKDKPERRIFNCASPGDIEILRRRDEIERFVHVDWGGSIQSYQYGRAAMQGKWYLLHHSGNPWFESAWKYGAEYMAEARQEGALMRSVFYQPRENDHFAFGEFTWNPKLKIDDYADLYVKKRLRKKDAETALLYSRWIKAKGYARTIAQLEEWRRNNTPFCAQAIDGDYPRLLSEEVEAMFSLLESTGGKNELFDRIGYAFWEQKDELLKLVEPGGV